jgi:hypothetical protein
MIDAATVFMVVTTSVYMIKFELFLSYLPGLPYPCESIDNGEGV